MNRFVNNTVAQTKTMVKKNQADSFVVLLLFDTLNKYKIKRLIYVRTF